MEEVLDVDELLVDEAPLDEELLELPSDPHPVIHAPIKSAAVTSRTEDFWWFIILIPHELKEPMAKASPFGILNYKPIKTLSYYDMPFSEVLPVSARKVFPVLTLRLMYAALARTFLCRRQTDITEQENKYVMHTTMVAIYVFLRMARGGTYAVASILLH